MASFRLPPCHWALLLLALIALSHYSHAVDYYVDVVLPRTGGTSAQNAKYEQMALAAELAETDINNEWSTNNFVLTVKDSANDGATSLKHVLDSAQAAQARVAIIGAGPDDMTRSAAQLLKNFDVRGPILTFHTSSSAPPLPASL
jgi:hypothetical protein